MSGLVHIVALGARTPIGLRAEPSAAEARARTSRLREHPLLVAPSGEPIIGAADGLLDPKIMGWPRVAELARSAMTEVLEKLDPPEDLLGATQVYLALPELRPGFTEADSSAVAASLKAILPSKARAHTIKPLCVGRGHAAGLHAMALATNRLRDGEADLCIVGGADSYFHPKTIGWLLAHGLLAHEGTRGGFPPGEGAGFVALASEAACRRWRLNTLGTVRGTASTGEKTELESQDTNLGEALTQAVTSATSELRASHEVITEIFCDINGERWRSEEWGFTVLRNSRALMDGSAYQAPASEWGDQGAASGPLLAVLAVQSWQRRYARGSHALLWAASRTGLRAAVVLKEPGR